MFGMMNDKLQFITYSTPGIEITVTANIHTRRGWAKGKALQTAIYHYDPKIYPNMNI